MYPPYTVCSQSNDAPNFILKGVPSSTVSKNVVNFIREYYQKNKEKCRAAKHKWYMEHREYALHYQKAYEHGVRIGKKGPCGKRR